MMKRVYACIDLKSFYASVECRERGLDPLTTNLVVADETRTDGTICLAVSPSLKEMGVPGRPRLFQAKEKVREINLQRARQLRENGIKSSKEKKNFEGNREKSNLGRNKLKGKSWKLTELEQNPELAVDFLIAPPRMRLYMEYSAQIYKVYLGFVSEEDILVYSIDEVFIDLTSYLKLYRMSAEELVAKMISAVHAKTGITATAGMGTNMYLAKVAMDIRAKHMEPNKLGVRMASLDERAYREQLWGHRPLKDFWRIGPGYTRKLEAHGMRTMGDVARASIESEELLFRLFGVNAELLIDHAWGWEPCTLAEAKAYRPATRSISRGQVMHGFYDFRQARVVVREMVDELVLKLVEKGVVTRQVVLWVAYTEECGSGATDVGLGRPKRKHARATVNFDHFTSSTELMMREVVRAYDGLAKAGWRIRKLNLAANDVVDEGLAEELDAVGAEQADLFGEYLRRVAEREAGAAREKRERRMQQAVLAIKKRYGKNAILRAMDFEAGATARERNQEVGGHKG